MSEIMFTLFLVLLVTQVFSVDAQLHYVNGFCGGDNNYTTGSRYQRNINRLFSNLSEQSSVRKFYNVTAGATPNRVYGLYQCREDLSPEICRVCIQDASQRIVQVCPLFGEAIVWYYECMLRYANRSIFSSYETAPSAYQRTELNVSNNDQFTQVLIDTMNGVISQAAASPRSGYFSIADSNFTEFDRVYCLAQCTRDLDRSGCNTCLRSALATLRNCCPSSVWSMVFMPSCQLRYDLVQFYNVTVHTPAAPRQANTPDMDSDSRLRPPIIVAIAVGASVVFLLVVLVLWLYLRPHKKMSTEVPTEISEDPPKESRTDDIGNVEFVQYDFATLSTATRNFASDNKLGEGGFGAVYKGILYGGQVIAIKRLSCNSGQGAREFMTEARLLAKLQHKNLVMLLGFCSEGEEKMLVYEFLPNSSVDRSLFDPRKEPFLDWETRYKIIMGIARGLQYLHEDSRLTIIHRDLKPSNILLDSDMNPKIADFGMAKLFGGEQKFGNTSRIVGTHGYMAPEYMLTGQYSDKSDVYSFGIIILELVSGQKNKILPQSPEKEDLSTLAWMLWNERRSDEFIDQTLNTSSSNEVMRCIQIGLLCVQGNPVNRPTTTSVVLMLNGSVALPLPSTPVISLHDLSMHHKPQQSISKSVSWSAEVEQDLYPR